MIVYRVEHIDSGYGPYYHYYEIATKESFHFRQIAGVSLFNLDHCPNPTDLEISDYYNDNYFYGFRSLEDLYKWFYDDECNNFLHTNKFKIIVYDTKHVLKSRKQIVFLKNESHVIDKIPLVK